MWPLSVGIFSVVSLSLASQTAAFTGMKIAKESLFVQVYKLKKKQIVFLTVCGCEKKIGAKNGVRKEKRGDGRGMREENEKEEGREEEGRARREEKKREIRHMVQSIGLICMIKKKDLNHIHCKHLHT